MYLVNTNNEIVFKRVTEQTGISDRGDTEITILDSIPANATLVINGTYYLHAKMKQLEEYEGGGEDHGH